MVTPVSQGCICPTDHGRFHAVSFENASRDTCTQTFICFNWPRNVGKFYAWQVVSLMNEHGKPKFVAKADPLFWLLATTSWSRKVKNSKHQPRWEFVYRIYRRRAFKAANNIRDTGFCCSYFAAFRTYYCICSKKFEGDLILRTIERASCLVIINLDFRCLELNLFSRCFDLKDLKTEEPFQTLEKGLIVYLTNCPKCMLPTYI